MPERHDTDDLLRKLAPIWDARELTGFEFGLRRYNTAPPPREVVEAVARRKVEIARLGQ